MNGSLAVSGERKSTGRSILAVVAGFFAVVVLSLGTDAVLHLTGVYPHSWNERMADSLFYLATAYRVIYTVAGNYLAARLAPSRPMFHSMILGAIGTFFALLGLAGTWNKIPEIGPLWYPIALVVTALPCAWLGGKIRESQLRAQPAQN